MAWHDGLPWRLSEEFEWEKAARGVDGRFFPWGDGFDASRACMRDSHKDQMLPAVVDSFILDESPYGVRGLAGNMRDLTATVYRKEGPPLSGGMVQSLGTAASVEDVSNRVARGGGWDYDAWYTRVADRRSNQPGYRSGNLGFRLARTVGRVFPLLK